MPDIPELLNLNRQGLDLDALASRKCIATFDLDIKDLMLGDDFFGDSTHREFVNPESIKQIFIYLKFYENSENNK